MKVVAPGKLLLSGAYAVLDGAPAVVAAVDRHAVADGAAPDPQPIPEVRAATGDRSPRVDASALFQGGRKLGLGSSAASVVAALGAVAVARGEDLCSEAVRRRILAEGREAHARVQQGGSGVDVAASVFGGVLRYELAEGGPRLRRMSVPPGLQVLAFACGRSARTSELRARVEALRQRDPRAHAACIRMLGDLASQAAAALEGGDTPGFVVAVRASAPALASLGRAADAPIVTPEVASLSERAAEEQAAFFPSGAGGGDVCVLVGMSAPSGAFIERARAAGLTPLGLAIDSLGVRVAPDL